MDERIKRIHTYIEEIIASRKGDFIPGETVITTGLAVYDHLEVNAVVDSLLDGWLGLAKRGAEFEQILSEYLTSDFSILVNSGSSANLLALNGVKNLLDLRGGEIITPACTFPATFNPIVQLGFKPAVVDIDRTLNIAPRSIEAAVNENTRGILFAHAMGNPARIDEILEIASHNNLFVIEDCCGALGSRYGSRMCGSFGIASTFSFYPAHGITMGEGGAVSTGSAELHRIIKSLRDWGRDCFCRSDQQGINGECGRRFDYQLGDVPYDHRYIYSQIGYNMKPLELQAAMGIEQLKKLNAFNEKRRRNFRLFKEGLAAFEDCLVLPEIHEKSDPVFFGLPLTISDERIDRRELIIFLNEHRVSTRLLFSGNILKQPAYDNIECTVYGDLSYSDRIMRDCFWIGVHQGITEEMIEYVISVFKKYFSSKGF